MKRMNWIGLAMLAGLFLFAMVNVEKLQNAVSGNARALVDVQTNTQQHTMDADAAIDWANGSYKGQ